MKTKLLITLSLALAIHAYADSATWNLNPISSDWNTATNWTPNTVPNGPADVATFGQSNITAVSISAGAEVNAITFDPGASAFTITLPSPNQSNTLILTVSGAGIINNSGITQNFIATSPDVEATVIQFTGNATAGDLATFTNEGSLFIGNAETDFFDDSTAGSATFVNEGTRSNDILAGGRTQFFDRSSAGEGTFLNLDGSGQTVFMGDSTAADGTFVVDSSVGVNGVSFLENSNAGNGNFTLNAPTGTMTSGGSLIFSDTASAANGIFTVNERAELLFGLASTAGNATLIANGDASSFVFQDDSSGGTARVELFDNATLIINFHDRPGVTIGSLEGTGFVRLADRDLTVGSNDLSTTFSGIIQNGGSLEKIGAGTLTLTGANTYQVGTTVSGGILLVSNSSGSGTGTGAVSVNAGTLGGSGIITGAVTVGTNTGVQAFLAPSKGVQKPATLTIQGALTLNDDSTYIYKLSTKRSVADEVIGNGVVIDSGAKFSFRPSGKNALTVGQVFTVISNTAATPIAGTFHNLADGKILTANGSNLQASYTGGDGNDLTLTVVP
jgi:autotransporter-associated beta strand protein